MDISCKSTLRVDHFYWSWFDFYILKNMKVGVSIVIIYGKINYINIYHNR